MSRPGFSSYHPKLWGGKQNGQFLFLLNQYPGSFGLGMGKILTMARPDSPWYFTKGNYNCSIMGLAYAPMIIGLAYVASFKGRINSLLNFEFRNETTRATLQVNKKKSDGHFEIRCIILRHLNIFFSFSFSGFGWRGSSRQIVEVSVADALILPGAQLTVK